MKNLLLLFTLFASGLYAQVDSLVGIYKNDRERESIQLNADNTFDVIRYSGSYRRDGNLVILNADRSFMLHKQQGNSQQTATLIHRLQRNDLGGFHPRLSM